MFSYIYMAISYNVKALRGILNLILCIIVNILKGNMYYVIFISLDFT